MSDLDTLGRAAFEGYRVGLDSPTFRDVGWHDLSPIEREAWRAAADAVRAAGELRHVEHRRLKFTRDTAVTAIEVAPLGPKGVVPTLHAETGDVLVCSPDGGEVYVQRGDALVAHYADDGLGVLRPRSVAS